MGMQLAGFVPPLDDSREGSNKKERKERSCTAVEQATSPLDPCFDRTQNIHRVCGDSSSLALAVKAPTPAA